MKEDYNREGRRLWLIWVSLIAVLLMGVGIFFYYAFLRQTPTELIEAVPTDAVFLYEINDHDAFVGSTKTIQPCFNELFAMDVIPAYESVYQKLVGKELPITVSGHQVENKFSLLINTRIERHDFRKLLRALSIDPANYTSYEQYKIYTYGTNFKSLKFVYFNHVLSVSDDVELLKKALMQHTHPKKLLSDKHFEQLYAVAEKNKKQNWLFVHNPDYFLFLETFFQQPVQQALDKLGSMSDWSAFQLRVSNNELHLSGYAAVSAEHLKGLGKEKTSSKADPAEKMPFNTVWYSKEVQKHMTFIQFAMMGDSNQLMRYVAVPHDSLPASYSPFLDVTQAEQFNMLYPSGLYPVTDSITLPSAVFVSTSGTPGCFVDRDGYYLFAPSSEAMQTYLQDLSKNGALVDNRHYQFANTNMASENLVEFVSFNSGERGHFASLLSQKGAESIFAKRLQVFSISCSNVDEDIAAVYIYVSL